MARSTEKPKDDEDFGCGDGVKFQTKWLPVEGTVPEFFVHLLQSLEAYLPHVYKIKMSNRADKYAERAFIIDPVAHQYCPDSKVL